MHYRERLKEWIADNDLKQKKIAAALDVTPSVLSNYVTGRTHMPIETLVELSRLFGVSVDYLAGTTDDPTPPARLTKAEHQLVKSFRTLSKSQKELILNNIAFMQNQNRNG